MHGIVMHGNVMDCSVMSCNVMECRVWNKVETMQNAWVCDNFMSSGPKKNYEPKPGLTIKLRLFWSEELAMKAI